MKSVNYEESSFAEKMREVIVRDDKVKYDYMFTTKDYIVDADKFLSYVKEHHPLSYNQAEHTVNNPEREMVIAYTDTIDHLVEQRDEESDKYHALYSLICDFIETNKLGDKFKQYLHDIEDDEDKIDTFAYCLEEVRNDYMDE